MEIGGSRGRESGVAGGGLGAVDAEGAVGAGEEEVVAVGFDGVDFDGGIVDELEGIVGAMHHSCYSSSFCEEKV